jgi:hypothetical protein
MDVSEAIKKTIHIFAEHRDSHWEVLVQAIEDSGIPVSVTAKLAEFMPLAFGRVLMKDLGISFREEYVRYVFSGGKTVVKQQRKLTDELVYRESLRIASKMEAEKIDGEEFLAVAYRSAEFNVVNDMELKGVKPENLVLTCPYLEWREENQLDISELKEIPGWWQFWK